MDGYNYSNEDIRLGLEFMKRIIMLQRQQANNSNLEQENNESNEETHSLLQ